MSLNKKFPQWVRELNKFTKASWPRAIWQLFSTTIAYLAAWGVMIWLHLHQAPIYTIFLVQILAAGLMVRLFIFFHDSCHGSFTPDRRWNRTLGYVTGILTFTPFEQWRAAHNAHHATSGDLNRRGKGDVWTLTVEEYRQAGTWKKIGYRLFRHPLVMFGLGPLYLFLVSNRLPQAGAKRAEKQSVWWTNGALLVQALLMSWWLGFMNYILLMVPILWLAGLGGIWLFYIQHQFEGTWWAADEEWNMVQAALSGSSFYKLPKVLQWFSGNIGFHHIHHLKPSIPNYYLPVCNNAVPQLAAIPALTIRKSLAGLRLHLWDDGRGRLIGFNERQP